MQVMFLGHAGFVTESEGAVIVADPWMSERGAFDSAWSQLPRNHALAPLVRQKLEQPGTERFLYVSHEHGDHLDREFLSSIGRRDFTVVIPRFVRGAMREFFRSYRCKEVIECDDGQAVAVPGGRLKLYVSDSVINRDSALLVRSGNHAFLDLNDCKIHDRLHAIAAEDGPIDVFTAQYSGAVWHPTCYDYDAATYAALSRRKMFGKFEAVARGIEALRPRAFLTSAGPPCFLDPALLHLNFQQVNIFPRPPKFFAFLERRLGEARPRLIAPNPGDVLDVAACELIHRSPERVTDEGFAAYVQAYAREMSPVFSARRLHAEAIRPAEVLAGLAEELARKLAAFPLRQRVSFPLYAALYEAPRALLVDFASSRVEVAHEIPAERRYVLRAGAFDLGRVLDRTLTWEEFLLSFRLRLSRAPDRYDPLLHAYLALEAEDLPGFCVKVLAAEGRQERIEVTARGQRYSVVRHCPHQGGDLAYGWVERSCLVCPRHRWRFDLEGGGRCISNDSSIDARPVDARDASRA